MVENFGSNIRKLKRDHVQALLVFFFLFPLFFQLSGSIFISNNLKFDTQGDLFLLPLPMASVFCFIGIAILLRLEKRHFGMGFVFSVFILMMLSTIVSTDGENKAELAKFILLIQFILPMFALVFGSLYLMPKSDYLRFEAVALYVLLLVVPLEVVSTIIRGTGVLSPYLHIFSLYQHLQYLPVIFIGLYFLTVNSLYKNNKLRFLIMFMAPWMGIYLSASLSTMAIILAVISTVISCWFVNKKRKYIILLVVLFWASFTMYYPITQTTTTYALKYSHELEKVGENVIRYEPSKFKIMTDLSNSLKEQLPYWVFYSKGIFESPEIFLFGHATRPDRNAYPSAHNFYLDLIYHFGMISLLPFIYLIFITIRNGWQVVNTGLATPDLVMLIALVGFFIFVDNSFQVSLRQPYPGMVMFFIWGILLTKISISDENLNTDT